jgi:hypothetical protein
MAPSWRSGNLSWRAVASVGRADTDALVLFDGGFPNRYSQPARSWPPVLDLGQR